MSKIPRLILSIVIIFSFSGLLYPQSEEPQESELEEYELEDSELKEAGTPAHPQREKSESEEEEDSELKEFELQEPQLQEPEIQEPQSQESEIQEPRSQEPATGKEYALSAGDMIQVAVYGEPDLTVDARISQDGTVNLPLLGNVRATGLGVRELERQITDLLTKDYLVNPQVTVFVKEYAKIFVFGMVGSPGSYELKTPTTIISAISLAGGFLQEADTSKVKFVRSDGQEKETKEIDLDAISNNTIPDIQLKPNDTIIVSELGRVSVIGQVRSPGTYNLKKNLTLLELIGMAGGFSPIADIDGTSVIRLEEGKKKIIRVRISDITKRGDKTKDIYIKSGDTVVVSESFF